MAAHSSRSYDRIGSGDRRLELQAPMRPGLVVVLDPLPHHQLQVSTADDQYPVQALVASGTDLALHVRIRFGRRDRGLDHPHALGTEHRVYRPSVLGVVIVNDEANRPTLELPDQVSALRSEDHT